VIWMPGITAHGTTHPCCTDVIGEESIAPRLH
jgi:hypothetical protein